MCEESIKLIRFQREIEEKLADAKNKLIGKTVHDTCKLLLEWNEFKLAEKFKYDYKIPDKRYKYAQDFFEAPLVAKLSFRNFL